MGKSNKYFHDDSPKDEHLHNEFDELFDNVPAHLKHKIIEARRQVKKRMSKHRRSRMKKLTNDAVSSMGEDFYDSE